MLFCGDKICIKYLQTRGLWLIVEWRPVSVKVTRNMARCKTGLLKDVLFLFLIRATNRQMKGHQNTKLFHWTRLKTLEFIVNSRFLKTYIKYICASCLFNNLIKSSNGSKKKNSADNNADVCIYVLWLMCWLCNHLNLCRYYSLEVSYFKSSLDRKLLEMLWNKYWVNTLSSSSLLTVRS